MKKINHNNPMRFTYLVLLIVLCLLTSSVHAAHQDRASNEVIEAEVRQFFDKYLDTYNQRFGHTDRTEIFIQSLAELIHTPFIMSPPNTAPFQPQGQTQLTRVFDGFVQQLEQKGAVKLAWKSVNLQVLTPHKVLANNIGYATDINGEVVYETISIYLVYRDDDQWKISLFSPYEMANKLTLLKR